MSLKQPKDACPFVFELVFLGKKRKYLDGETIFVYKTQKEVHKESFFFLIF